jgi:hypothetical protein
MDPHPLSTWCAATVYTWLGTDDATAEENAREVVARCHGLGSAVIWPTRLSTTLVNLGQIAGRRGDLDEAVGLGQESLRCGRRSAELLPRAAELERRLAVRYGAERLVNDYGELLREEFRALPPGDPDGWTRRWGGGWMAARYPEHHVCQRVRCPRRSATSGGIVLRGAYRRRRRRSGTKGAAKPSTSKVGGQLLRGPGPALLRGQVGGWLASGDHGAADRTGWIAGCHDGISVNPTTTWPPREVPPPKCLSLVTSAPCSVRPTVIRPPSWIRTQRPSGHL